MVQRNQIDLPACKIVLADDDVDDCLFFEDALIELAVPCILTKVYNGEDLFTLISQEIPQLLFLDLNMPRKNGFQCLTEIRSDPKYDTMSIIVMSTSFNKNLVEKLHQSGAQHFIQKPSDFTQLKSMIDVVIHLLVDKTPAQNNTSDKSLFENFHILPETIS